MRLLDLPDALRDQGVEPVVLDGFQSRGLEFDGKPTITLRHWTAGPSTGKAPSLRTVVEGRSDLPGPLCQVLQERTGGPRLDRAFCVASGRANHAGVGEWAGITSGNRHGTGLEIEWSGPSEAFPANRNETADRIIAALQSLSARPSGANCCDHREYALPAGRKQDTNLDSTSMRTRVDRLLRGEGDDMDADQDARLKRVERLLDALVPRTMRVITDGSSPDFGKRSADGEPVADIWRWALYMEWERSGKESGFANKIADAVIAKLPAGGGGGGLTQEQVRAACATAVDEQLGFLKPGQ